MADTPAPRIAVIGAGPAGLTAAYELSKTTPNVVLFEAGPQVGGLSRSLDLWGQRVDLGPHRFFSADPRVNTLWLEIVGTDYRMVDRLTRMYYRGKFFRYPLQAGDALRKLGPLEAFRSGLSYLRQGVAPMPEDGSFAAWVTRRFGRRLFETFFKSYSEKLWGISTHELDADFAAQRIKGLSLTTAVLNALGFGKNAPKTLLDRFAYPTGGTGMVYARMAERIIRNGGWVFQNTPVQRVVTENGRVTGLVLENGNVQAFDHVISSMPLTLLVERLPEAPPSAVEAARSLRFRNTVLVFLQVDRADLFPDQWLYVHEPRLQLGRITNFRNWVPELNNGRPETVLALEYWCNAEDPAWQRDDAAWAALAEKELTATGLLAGAKVLAHHLVRLPRCYPVYTKGYKAQLAPVVAYLKAVQGLQAIGRYGAFKYNNQDHSILMGRLAAENALGISAHDLWAINADTTYHEATRITETGLEPA